MGDWEEEMDARTGAKRNGGEGLKKELRPHSFSLPFACPFPRPSLPFDERAWIFDLPVKEESVWHSSLNIYVSHLRNRI